MLIIHGDVLQEMEDGSVLALVRDTDVPTVPTKEFMKWKWDLIFSVLQVSGHSVTVPSPAAGSPTAGPSSIHFGEGGRSMGDCT